MADVTVSVTRGRLRSLHPLFADTGEPKPGHLSLEHDGVVNNAVDKVLSAAVSFIVRKHERAKVGRVSNPPPNKVSATMQGRE
eukprot:CAMPEP_0114428092 /NCGR_PEP_ID=MMETSP0103-20121206/8737_1 /TAXON_ID=37642 ORGANISM="Paraphysomonas imperforata, Strain PA2" /NCGR_SAMPLE_ID=MMETSP0103 /ASSEMBLY_ACC=CAM_ASM_000201 /LENGTH=82 /DNA_ID=CAMNT_0001597277 /DNA_START=181 /DNA_END=429 /DNA_ORIENTATION=-